ncbi:MAG: phosphate signaling complex protein PhoU [Bacteroidetes bacterium]|jgi:phosphate transport system protein|nr:phosphate signaling complex protein PhoU [Bacteroidota bacterium]
MERQLSQDLERLKANLIRMGSLVQQSVSDSLEALLHRSEANARQVLDRDEQVDSLELEIDEEVLDLLALRQPVASDLRFIIAAQKINNDLERIGDHAVNIAQSAVLFAQRTFRTDMLDMPVMADIGRTMLREALDSFIRLDPALARSVIIEDDKMDDRNRVLSSKVIEVIRRDPEALEWGLEMIRISRNLERVSDLATNIAEETIFLTQARMVKHKSESDL